MKCLKLLKLRLKEADEKKMNKVRQKKKQEIRKNRIRDASESDDSDVCFTRNRERERRVR